MQRNNEWNQWRTVAQPKEFLWHATTGKTWGTLDRDRFDFFNNRFFQSLCFAQDDFNGKAVLDIGAGSRLRSKFFRGAKIVVLDALADRYSKELAWSDIRDADTIYSKSAEEFIPDLKGEISLAMCINVLDHTYNPEQILRNVAEYLKPVGQVIVSVDLHDRADEMHPIGLNRSLLIAMVERAGFTIERQYLGLPEKKAWGHGLAYSLVLSPKGKGMRRRRLFHLVIFKGFWTGLWRDFVEQSNRNLRRAFFHLIHTVLTVHRLLR